MQMLLLLLLLYSSGCSTAVTPAATWLGAWVATVANVVAQLDTEKEEEYSPARVSSKS